MASAEDPPGRTDPPPPPSLEREVRLYPHQWVAIPILVLIPILGLAGVFGTSLDRLEASAGEILLEVEYPDRSRRGKRNAIEVQVSNRSTRSLDRVQVRFAPEYLGAFTDLSFIPALDHAYEVLLHEVGPGETRVIHVELEGERAWRHHGWITAVSGADSARVDLRTFLFP